MVYLSTLRTSLRRHSREATIVVVTKIPIVLPGPVFERVVVDPDACFVLLLEELDEDDFPVLEFLLEPLESVELEFDLTLDPAG